MSFIRTKEIPPGSGRFYNYEVENYRQGGQVKQRLIRYLGRTGAAVNSRRANDTALQLGTTHIVKRHDDGDLTVRTKRHGNAVVTTEGQVFLENKRLEKKAK